MSILSNYQNLESIYESIKSSVYRGQRYSDNDPIIIKVLQADYPTPEELGRYQQEYDIMCHLANIEGIVNAYSLEKHQNILVLCLEDFGGESLAHWLAKHRFSLKELLPLAIQIAEILGQIHRQQVIHKDINPSNIIWNATTNQMKIIDFGISSQLSLETPTLKNPNVLEGTLAYISPEQTGRMNCTLDYRTDFYSLGVTFYEMLTGQLPFESPDPLNLVHCHIAKTPVPASQISVKVPKIISDIVMKLMAKNVEDRYQSAFGLKWDLEKCLENLEGIGNLQDVDFKLAQHDFSEQFHIPQKLYGRENEVNTLLQAFEHVANSKSKIEMMLVAGYSGVGKTALVREVYKPMTEKHGYFAAGKFEQYQRNVPYLALTQAFNEFCHYLLTETTEQLNQWREKILSAVGPNGQILIDVIPDLKLIIGSQPAVAQVGPQEAQNRFNLVFQNFLQATCQPEHPLVLFIDDWQWADSASLTLLQNLLSDPENHHLLIIGAYRDNEVDASHPFLMMLEELKKANVTVNQIELSNLSHSHINALISEALGCKALETDALTDLVYEKTHGNAFFTTEFLKSLSEEKLLVFDAEKQQWQWNITKITAKSMTDNVVELMANKIGNLPTDTQTVLTLAACIGNTFDFKTLSIIAQQQLSEIQTPVLNAITEGLVVPLDDNYKHLKHLELDKANPRFKFQHDRVQQAAYSLIAETNKQVIHLRIGRLLLANTTTTHIEDNLFDIVNHFNEGSQLLDDETETRQLAELNLKAGKKAKEATAYVSASQYLAAGIGLLAQNSWQQHYPLTFALHKEQAEVAYLNGHFEAAEKMIHATLAQAQSVLEQAELYYLWVRQYIQMGKYESAILLERKGLALLEIYLPEVDDLQTALDIEVAKAKKEVGNRDIALLLDEPTTNNLEAKITINLLWKLMEAAYGTGSEVLSLFTFAKIANISLKYGSVPESSLGFFSYATLLSLYGEHQSGYEFSLLALKLTRKFAHLAYKCIVCEGIVGNLHFLVKPLKLADVLFQEGYQAGLESGTLSQTNYLIWHQCFSLFYRGENLETTLKQMNNFLLFAKKTKNEIVVSGLLALEFAIWNLTARTVGEKMFHNHEIDEVQYLASCQEDLSMNICLFHILKSQILYLYNEPDKAYQCALEAKKLLAYIASFIHFTEYHFYYSLILTSLYPTVSEPEQQQYWKQLETNQAKIKAWADNCAENFLHKYLLVEAEMARISGRELEAMDLYDRAIVLATENEFIQIKALGNELAAKFWLVKGKEEFAQIYLKKAYYSYQLWGAKRKVADLEAKYSQFLSKQVAQSSVSRVTTIPAGTLDHLSLTQFTPTSFLDLNSVIKASQTLSGEIVLSRLLEKMMQIVIENAAAEKGFLLLPQEDNWFIEAEGYVNTTEVTVLQTISIVKSQQVAESIIYYVARTQESLVLNNATGEGQFTRDPYIISQRPKSVLCTPLINQGQLTGILYLENNLTLSAFTPNHLEILQVLSSQLAISIENALLYRTLEQKVAQRTTQLAEANQEIMALNEQLQSENLRMKAELEVSRQLQQMLLPKQTELNQIDVFEIAGFMEPADEVGGDYYDVFQHQGRIIFGIGDVTGHGLESGALAMMLQTAVRTLQLHNETDPVKFLNTLNQVIYYNVERMNANKNMTFALLDYQKGYLHLSGQHEDVIVVRNGHLELISTENLGFPLGLEKDIVEWITQIKIELNSGNVVVLYSDGITEAENIERELYGIERLCEVIKQNWHQAATDIREAVINDVRQYIGTQEVFDDITLLVIKQK